MVVICLYCKGAKSSDEMHSEHMCISCRRARTNLYVRNHYQNNLESERARNRHKPKTPGYSAMSAARDRINHPGWQNARVKLHRAVKSGKVIKQPCIVCSNPNSRGHHTDYNKPLAVIWLCPVHHKEVHNASPT